MFYVICPPEETDWCFDRGLLVAALLREWPGAKVVLGSDEASLRTRDVVWRIQFDEGELEGSQDRAGQAHFLDGPFEAVVRYALWWRKQVPETQALILCDESYSSDINLTLETSAEDIFSVFA